MSTLESVLESEFDSFADFCRLHHAAEGVEFWAEVEAFKRPPKPSSSLSFRAWPMTSPRRRVSSLLQQQLPRRSSATSLSPSPPSSPGLEDHELTKQQVARRVFDKYLDCNSPSWICVQQQMAVGIADRIDSGDVASELFDHVQLLVVRDLSYNLLPMYLLQRSTLRRHSSFSLRALSSRPHRGSSLPIL